MFIAFDLIAPLWGSHCSRFRDKETDDQRSHPDPNVYAFLPYLTQTWTDSISLAIHWLLNSILAYTPVQQMYTKPLLYANPLWGTGCPVKNQKAWSSSSRSQSSQGPAPLFPNPTVSLLLRTRTGNPYFEPLFGSSDNDHILNKITW